MTSGRCSVMKELHKLIRNADKLYDGQVEFVLEDGEKEEYEDEGEKEEYEDEGEDVEDENESYMDIFFFVTTKEGPYRNARIKFKMRVDRWQYPDEAPLITCINRIYHPNILIQQDCDESDICVNLLDCDWEPEVGLDGAVMAVLFLFYNPQLDDYWSEAFTGEDDYDTYEEKVRRSLRGKDIDEYQFDKLLDELTDKEDNEDSEGNGITEDTDVKNDDGAGAASGGIVDNVENIGTASEENLENVEKIDAISEEVLENVEKADAASVEILDNVEKVATASGENLENVDKFNAASEVMSENVEKVDTASDKILSNIDLTHQKTSKYSVFKFWYSKLKAVFSPIRASFKKRS